MTRVPSLGPRGEGWVVLQVLLFAGVALGGAAAGGAWSGPVAILTSALGLGLMALGALLAGRGLLDLGRNLTPLPHPRDGAQLVGSGAYRLVRHPIYGGLIALAFGWGLLTASPLVLVMALLLAGLFQLKSRREEAWLLERFPEYASYMLVTGRFFPRLR